MIEKDFLKNFEQRMKFVGRYALLCSNSFGKQQWKDYGIETRDEQMNMLFTLLLLSWSILCGKKTARWTILRRSWRTSVTSTMRKS